jgi:hypothetical protein
VSVSASDDRKAPRTPEAPRTRENGNAKELLLLVINYLALAIQSSPLASAFSCVFGALGVFTDTGTDTLTGTLIDSSVDRA